MADLGLEQTFAALVNQLRADRDVFGAFLSGSRGKRFHTDSSDYDIYIIAQDDTAERAKQRYPFRHSAKTDCIVLILTEFRVYAEWGSSNHWNRYSFAHIEVLFKRADRTIQKLVEQKGKIPAEYRTEVLRQALDAYLNAVYRSFKCLGKDNELEAAASIPFCSSFYSA